jgi:hypothetical protein
VAHGLYVRKQKERIAKKRYTAPMSKYGGGEEKRKEKKRKEPGEIMRLEPAKLRVSN